MFKDEGDVCFAFRFFAHDFDPAFASVFEQPLFAGWSLFNDVESFFVGDVFESLDFVDDFGLELLGEVLESLGDEFDVGVGEFEEGVELLYGGFLEQVVLEELGGSADEFVMRLIVVNGFEDLFLLDPVDELFF